MGYFIVFEVEQYTIREEIRNNLNLGFISKGIDVISIEHSVSNTVNTVFERDGNEFIYKGKRYDILKEESNAASTTFYAINDKKEEHLFSSLEQHVDLNVNVDGAAKHSDAKNLNHNIIKTYFFESTDFSIFNNSITIKFPPAEHFYHSIDGKTALLPPKIA